MQVNFLDCAPSSNSYMEKTSRCSSNSGEVGFLELLRNEFVGYTNVTSNLQEKNCDKLEKKSCIRQYNLVSLNTFNMKF